MWSLKEKANIAVCSDCEFPTIVNKETPKPEESNKPDYFVTCNLNVSETGLINTMLLGRGGGGGVPF